ncbi:MAG: hypothetical protein V4456_10365 [Bacteroidota bacterium]
MLKTTKFRFVFALAVLMYLFLSINTLLTKSIDSTSVDFINLHLKEVSGNRPSRGSLNYDLYVTESNEHYKIGADWASCFSYDTFFNNVKPGQPIKVGVRKDNGFFSSDLKLVVFLSANNQTYLGSGCVNRTSSDDKIQIPIFGALGLVFIYILFYYQELKDVGKNSKKKQLIKSD